jgi:hypothetical protein
MRAISLGLLGGALTIYVAAALRRFVAPAEPQAPRVLNVSAFLALAPLLVGLASLLFVMNPIFFSPRSYDEVLGTWRRGLPMVMIVSALATFASSALGKSAPAGLAFQVSMPLAVCAAFAWLAHSTLAGLISPDDAAGRAELERYSGPIMTLLTAFPAIVFVAGFVAAWLGRRLRIDRAPR